MTHLMHKLNARNRLEVVIAAQRLNAAALEAAGASPRMSKPALP